MKKTYICTAIPYANGYPHIGHVLDYLLADVYARYRRELGDEVRFQVGTDEHGNKVFRKAQSSELTIEEYTTANSNRFREFIDRLDVTYTDFVRTTDPEHMRRCQEIWRRLSDHIYLNEYHGWYCEGCEGFVTEKEYAENHGICPDHQRPYQKLSEQNYYLRIADFKDAIREKILNNEMEILPAFRRQEALKMLEDAPDISISRPVGELSWGVPVPGDESQVMYVWLDALSNYITILGYPDSEYESDFREWWPADVQFVGKDILRFHAITWPAILLGLGLKLPRRIVSHGFVLANGQKMSKTIGNVIDPLEVLESHGLEAFRYFFLRHVDTFADSDFTWAKYEEAYNNELANDLGNLVQRLATLCQKNQFSGVTSADRIIDQAYCDFMNKFEFTKALDLTWQKIQNINQSIDQTKPWELAKRGDVAKLHDVLHNLVEQLLTVASLLQPFLPDTATNIYNIFSASEIKVPASPLFPKNK